MTNKIDRYVIAVHILFAIVIGSIFANFHAELFPISTGTFSFKSALIFMTLTTILLSWVGYNKKVEESGHGSGVLFIIDFVIIYFYFQMAYSINVSFSLFVLSLGLIFLAYLVWYPIKYIFDRGILKNKKYLIQILLLIVSTVIIFGIYTSFGDEGIEDIDLSNDSTEYEMLKDGPHWWILLFLLLLLIPFRIIDLLSHKNLQNNNSKV